MTIGHVMYHYSAAMEELTEEAREDKNIEENCTSDIRKLGIETMTH